MERGIFEFGNWMLDFSEEWSEWFSGRWNWVNFTLIKIYYEDEICMGQRELELRLLGVGVRIVHLYNRETPMRSDVKKMMGELLANEHKDQTP